MHKTPDNHGLNNPEFAIFTEECGCGMLMKYVSVVEQEREAAATIEEEYMKFESE